MQVNLFWHQFFWIAYFCDLSLHHAILWSKPKFWSHVILFCQSLITVENVLTDTLSKYHKANYVRENYKNVPCFLITSMVDTENYPMYKQNVDGNT